MSTKLLLGNLLSNRRIFELDSKYPYLAVDTFASNASVDIFFQTPDFLVGVTQLGSINCFVDSITLRNYMCRCG